MGQVLHGSATTTEAVRRAIQFARGEPISISEHAALSSTLVRLAAKIGIGRVAKSVPTLADYLANHPAAQEVDE
jgi:hypothetical protein